MRKHPVKSNIRKIAVWARSGALFERASLPVSGQIQINLRFRRRQYESSDSAKPNYIRDTNASQSWARSVERMMKYRLVTVECPICRGSAQEIFSENISFVSCTTLYTTQIRLLTATTFELSTRQRTSHQPPVTVSHYKFFHFEQRHLVLLLSDFSRSRSRSPSRSHTAKVYSHAHGSFPTKLEMPLPRPERHTK